MCIRDSTYMNEKDNTIGSVLTGDQRSAFKLDDIVYKSGVNQDSLGDYQLINDIFYYNPSESPSVNRYSITFSLDPEGLYIRKISIKNRIFYEFVGMEKEIETIDRYSPGRPLIAPESLTVILSVEITKSHKSMREVSASKSFFISCLILWITIFVFFTKSLISSLTSPY